MKPSVVITRARNRGQTESIKTNNFQNQVLHDQQKLANLLIDNDEAIEQKNTAFLGDTQQMRSKIYCLDLTIKEMLEHL